MQSNKLIWIMPIAASPTNNFSRTPAVRRILSGLAVRNSADCNKSAFENANTMFTTPFNQQIVSCSDALLFCKLASIRPARKWCSQTGQLFNICYTE